MENILSVRVQVGMVIDQFQAYLKSHPEMDQEMDNYIANEMNSKTNFILDYRLGFHFIENSFNVLLKVSPETALKRIGNRKNADEQYFQLTYLERVEKMSKRNQSMRMRFIDLYNIDFMDAKCYHLIIETNEISPENIVKEISENMKLLG